MERRTKNNWKKPKLKMTKFANLSQEAIELIAGSPPGEDVEEAIRLVSENKDLSKVTKGTLVKVVEYLFKEFDVLRGTISLRARVHIPGNFEIPN